MQKKTDPLLEKHSWKIIMGHLRPGLLM